jgi:group I intron endonuclease
MLSGIYKITNIVNNKIYIGSSCNLKNREWQHFNQLKRNKHSSIKLQNAYNKYEKDKFKFEIIAKCPEQYLIKLEQWFIDNLKPEYNIFKKAGKYIKKNGFENLSKSISKKHKEDKENRIKNNRYKLNKDQVIEIKKLIAYNKTALEISKIFNVAQNTIQSIKSKRTWTDVPDYIVPENEKHLINNIKIQSRHLTKYSDEILIEAIKDRINGLSIKEIRKKYNLGKQVENILYKKSRVYLWDKINNN